MADKPDLSQYMPEGWEGKVPPCQIQVDKEGNLGHFGAPIIHPHIRELIFNSVYMEDGLYFLEVDGKTCQLEVEDTFHVVQRAEVKGGDLELTLSDGSRETLDPATLWIGGGDVLYCRIKEGRFPARFSRPAYYQIAGMVEEKDGGFALVLGSRAWPLAVK